MESSKKDVKNRDYIIYMIGSIISIALLFPDNYIISRWGNPSKMETHASFKSLLYQTNLTALFLIAIIGSLSLLVAFSFTKKNAPKIVFASIAPVILIQGTIIGIIVDEDFHVGVVKYHLECTSVNFGGNFYIELILLFGLLALTILNANGIYIFKVKQNSPNQPILPYQQQNPNQQKQVFQPTDSITASPTVQPPRQSPKNDEWLCSNCGRINKNYVGTCGCGLAKADNVSTPNTSTYTQQPAQTFSNGKWACSKCNTINPKIVTKCLKCGEMKQS